jgi:hypothetical protein
MDEDGISGMRIEDFMETGKTLIDHWSWAAEKGVMNHNTAAGLRAACVQVLGVLENPEQVEFSSLDVEDLLTRFQNLRKQRFKPQVLEAYKRRFRNAVRSYTEYLENPGTWKPASQERAGSGERRERASSASKVASGTMSEPTRARPALVGGGNEEYRLPLRPSVMARLILPLDLTLDEATRVKAFVDMLVVPNPKQGEPMSSLELKQLP